MNAYRKHSSYIAAKATLALGLLSSLVLTPQTAFAQLPIVDIASFNGINGANPYSTVSFDESGNLYGTTIRGGPSNSGTVYEIAKGSRTITTVASFNDANGTGPSGTIAFDSSGNLFGKTSYGGPNVGPNSSGNGVVYEVAKGSNTIVDLGSFGVGSSPASQITVDSSGNLFGIMGNTVYEIAQGSNAITTIASVPPTEANGPDGIILDSSGNIFGTAGGGTTGQGSIFEIAKGSSIVSTIASFDGANGANPYDNLTFDSNGDLFGTTASGGADIGIYGNGYGAVFELAKGSNTITNVAPFNGINGDGHNPITVDKAGDIFGTSFGGGTSGVGQVYEIVRGSGTVTDIASFDNANGSYPTHGVAIDSSGNLFGSTGDGGANGDGVVFEIAGVEAVPETSSAISFGLLLTLGTGALFGVGRRRKRVSA